MIAAAAVAVYLTTPRITGFAPDELTADATPQLRIELAHAAGATPDAVNATIDGERIDAGSISVDDAGEVVLITAPKLADGAHDVVVRAERVGLLRRSVEARWSLTVDTTAPEVEIVTPRLPRSVASNAYLTDDAIAVTKLPLRLSVSAEPGTQLTISSSAQGFDDASANPSEDPRRTVALDLPDGQQTLTATATDAAGNETTSKLTVVVDTTGPKLSLKAPRVVKDATLNLPISGTDAHGVLLTATLDGRALEADQLQLVSSTPPPNAAAGEADEVADSDPVDVTDADGEDPSAAPVEAAYKLVLTEPAYEGRHVLKITATDALGATSTLTRRFVVDSTDTLGEASGLRVGARGTDVIKLHDALIAEDVVKRAALAKDRRAKTFGAQTKAAVQAFQKQQGLDADGVAGGTTIATLTLKIVIDRASHKLTLYRAGDLYKTWNVAVGSPQYPTPAGEFRIQTMQKDPTWTPPDSDWAKDAEVTPPGPDNPLGTRWMAIDGTVGIHGTNNPASLGYSVSHGCIRMAIPDVEELYDIVSIGTPVTVT